MATPTESLLPAKAQLHSARSETANGTEQLLSELGTTHTLPLWAQMEELNPPAPNPSTISYVWRYDELRPHLLRASDLISEKQAERRVLMLVNPARDAPYTTDTLYAGLQFVMPNETAPAHRHVAFAMRFIIKGKGDLTAVHGRRIKMCRGDVILTPTMNWHDHVHFLEQYQKPRCPAEDVDTSASPIVFPWSRMKADLDNAGQDWVSKLYLKSDGREVSKTIGRSTECLYTGASSPEIRETSSCVSHVVSGFGSTAIDGKTFKSKQSDTFCIPSWKSYQHFAETSEHVYFYLFDDKPMLGALGFYRKDGVDVETLVSD